MTEAALKGVKEIMADMNFHPTEVLIMTMLDLYRKYGIIDSKILEILNKRA